MKDLHSLNFGRGDMMKVLFTHKHKYRGRTHQGYEFIDEFGDLIIVSSAKLVNRDEDSVIMFLESDGEEKIEYSYSTQERLGLNDVNLQEITIS